MDDKQAEAIGGVSRQRSVAKVLNAGSGARSARALHPVFMNESYAWQETRIDIDPEARADIVGSIIDMRFLVPAQSFDAVWCSHTLEHLYSYEVSAALSEFRRILKPNGFALITSPDLETIALMIYRHGVDYVAYVSPAGPITPLDMLFGHIASIARGRHHMAHNTGFTCASLGQKLSDAGFPIVYAKREGFDLWALALMEEADRNDIRQRLLLSGLDLFERPEA